ncbi:MAG: rhodanese-like domain-containing protein [Huintestinicola sp.]
MNYEITAEKLRELPEGSYIIADIRDSAAFSLGHIDGAVNIPQNEIESRLSELPADKKVAVCCKSGIVSRETAELLREHGFDALNLSGGYAGWLAHKLEAEDAAARSADIERSIITKFHREIFGKFTKAVKEYELIKPGDRIAVCISGGKDSMLMAKLIQELKKHGKVPFEAVYLVMDPGYSAENREIIEKNTRLMNIPAVFFETNIFNSVYNVENNPCYLCARMRRGWLYGKAKELGCNKIALGHHFDDVIETILMSVIYGGQTETMLPKLHSANFEGMQLIRPLYLIREADILRWKEYNKLHFIQCACRFTDTCTTCDPDGRTVSKRMTVKRLIAELAKDNPQIEKNIFRSVENVNLKKIISYKSGNEVHTFLDNYDD